MSLFRRSAAIIEAKVNALINASENPDETLDLSYEKMLSSLQETKRHMADVVTEQKMLEQQMQAAKDEMAKCDNDARLALQAKREDLARTVLEQKQAASAKLISMTQARDSIATQAQKLIDYEHKLETQIDQFRTQKEILKSQYDTAQAEVKVNESVSGMSNKLGDVGENVRRAKDKTAQMQARAQAMDSLSDSGVLDDELDSRSQSERELDKLRTGSTVDADLERLKGELNKKNG